MVVNHSFMSVSLIIASDVAGWTKTPMAEESLKDPDVVYRALAT